ATVLLAFVLTMAWTWKLRGLRPGAGLYARALRIGRFWGVQSDPTKTPAEYAQEFSRAVPSAKRAIRVVTDIYSAEQYGRREVSASTSTTGKVAWRELRRTVLRWRPWGRRKGRITREAEGVGD